MLTINFDTGETYEFQVRAVNEAGPGLPSDATHPVTVKAKFQAPKIDRSALNTVRIKAGQGFAFDVNISGEPPPDKKWMLKGKEVVCNVLIAFESCIVADSFTYSYTIPYIHSLNCATYFSFSVGICGFIRLINIFLFYFDYRAY